jgi:hypothetical protein
MSPGIDTTLLIDSAHFPENYEVDLQVDSWMLFQGHFAMDLYADVEAAAESLMTTTELPSKMGVTPSSARRKQQSFEINFMMDQLMDNIGIRDTTAKTLFNAPIDWLSMDFQEVEEEGFNLLLSPDPKRVSLLPVSREEFWSYEEIVDNYTVAANILSQSGSRVRLPR